MKTRSGALVVAFVGTLASSALITGCAGENQATPASGSEAAVTKGGDARTGHYDVVENWWKAAPDHDDEWLWGQVAGVVVDTPDRILAVTRG